jgi:hypothetical protein
LKYKYYLVLPVFAGKSQKSEVGTKITKITRHKKHEARQKIRASRHSTIKSDLRNALKLGILGLSRLTTLVGVGRLPNKAGSAHNCLAMSPNKKAHLRPG